VDFKKNNSEWYINFEMNLMPGYMYVSQLAAIDARENPIQEKITVLAAKADAEPTHNFMRCANAQEYYEYKILGERALADVHYYTYQNGERKPDLCSTTITDTKYGTPASSGSLDSLGTNSQVTGQSTAATNERIFSMVGDNPSGHDATTPGAIWLPRALQAAIFNPKDAGADDPAQAYKDNHQIRAFYRNVQDTTNTQSHAAVETISDLHDNADIALPWASGMQSLVGSQKWYKTRLALMPYTSTSFAANNSGSSLVRSNIVGYGNSLQVTVQGATNSPNASERKKIQDQQDAVNLAQKTLDGNPGNTDSFNTLTAARKSLTTLQEQRNNKLNETRLISLIGETRYPSKWTQQDSCDTTLVDPCAIGGLKQVKQRLTADLCPASTTEQLPKVLVPSFDEARPCNSSTSSIKLGDGMTIGDAYTIPSLPGDSQTELVASFTQEDSTNPSHTTSISQPAKIQLDSSDSDSINKMLRSIDVWTRDNYMKHMGVGNSPDTTVGPSYTAQINTADTARYINFCNGCNALSVDQGKWADGLPVYTSTPAKSLPAGDYVVVFNLVNASGSTATKTISRWGVSAELYDYPTREWVNSFDLQNKHSATAVFQSRAIG